MSWCLADRERARRRGRSAGWVAVVGGPALVLLWACGIAGVLPLVEAGPRPCEIRTVEVGPVPPAPADCPVGELPRGTVFELASRTGGPLWMRVAPHDDPTADGWAAAGPGDGWVYAADLATGELYRLPATWRAWPVIDWRIRARTDAGQ
jgi:hypothetical protein